LVAEFESYFQTEMVDRTFADKTEFVARKELETNFYKTFVPRFERKAQSLHDAFDKLTKHNRDNTITPEAAAERVMNEFAAVDDRSREQPANSGKKKKPARSRKG
jgi:predicted secreted protein